MCIPQERARSTEYRERRQPCSGTRLICCWTIAHNRSGVGNPARRSTPAETPPFWLDDTRATTAAPTDRCVMHHCILTGRAAGVHGRTIAAAASRIRTRCCCWQAASLRRRRRWRRRRRRRQHRRRWRCCGVGLFAATTNPCGLSTTRSHFCARGRRGRGTRRRAGSKCALPAFPTSSDCGAHVRASARDGSSRASMHDAPAHRAGAECPGQQAHCGECPGDYARRAAAAVKCMFVQRGEGGSGGGGGGGGGGVDSVALRRFFRELHSRSCTLPARYRRAAVSLPTAGRCAPTPDAGTWGRSTTRDGTVSTPSSQNYPIYRTPLPPRRALSSEALQSNVVLAAHSEHWCAHVILRR